MKPMKIKDMDIQEHNHEKENKQYVISNNVKKYFDPRVESDCHVTDEQKCNFYVENLRCSTQCCVKYFIYATSML